MAVFTWQTVEQPRPVAPAGASTATAAASAAADTARDFAIDLDTGELLLEGGDLVWVRGLDAIKQDATTALRLVRGEWFLDEDEGFDLFGAVLVKSPNLDVIRAEVRRVLLTVEGIRSVTAVDVQVDRATRAALVEWVAETDLGALVSQTRFTA